MKRVLVASLLGAALLAAPALAQGNGGGNGGPSGGNGGGHDGGSHGASASAPGHNKGDGGNASAAAPGRMKADGDDASAYAPGRVKAASGETTASVGKPNFGTVISTIRAGKSDLAGIASDVDFTVVDASELGGGAPALANAIRDNRAAIEALRDELAALDIDGLTDAQIDAAIATRVEADGSLTIFVE